LRLAVAAGAQSIVGGCDRPQDARQASPNDAPRLRPPALPAGFVDSDGFQIHYESWGAGAPIVLVHGWGSSIRENWVRTGWVEALRAERRVVALDVRGHGDSDKPHDQAAYSYSRMARDVLRVMDRLGIAKADLLGYSMGSFMGASLLGQAPGRFSSMILGGIGDETDQSLALLPRIVAGLRAENPERLTDPVSLGYRKYVDADPRNDREALALAALQMWPEGFPLRLIGSSVAQLDVPVLVVNGATDHPYIDTVHGLIDACRGAELAVIPDRDHLSVVADPRFKEHVLKFLAARRQS
jgi:pimeloyl-ACP methyl ester carboxylesterase